MSGNSKLNWEFAELQSITPVVRTEILKGELSRRVQGLHTVPLIHLDPVVDQLLALPLAQIVEALHDQSNFEEQVKTAAAVAENDKPVSSNPIVGLSGLSITPADVEKASFLAQGGASATVVDPTSSPPRPTTPIPEKDRLTAAVSKLGDTPHEDLATIVDLLLSLPKRERALCLFNHEYLKMKVLDAKEVLAANDDDVHVSSNQSAPAGLERPTPSPREDLSIKATSDPVVPRAMSPLRNSEPPTSFDSSSDAQDEKATPTYTLKTLAALPAKQIIQLLDTPSESVKGLDLPTPNPQIVRATDELVDSVAGKPAPQQKQILGKNL